MLLLPGIDLSFSRLTPPICDRLWAEGVRVIAQGVWTGASTPAPAQDNLRLAQQRGFITMAYIVVTGTNSGEWHARQGRAALDDATWAGLALAPIDVEVAGTPGRAVRQAIELVYAMGKPRCLYTRRGFWQSDMGNDRSFADCLLWDANYDYSSALHFTPYGGWTMRQLVGRQYTDTQHYSVNGTTIDIDRNTFVEDLLAAGDEEGDDDMPIPWVRPKEPQQRYRTYIITGGRKRLVESKDHEDALLNAGAIVAPVKELPIKLLTGIPSLPGTPEPDAP